VMSRAAIFQDAPGWRRNWTFTSSSQEVTDIVRHWSGAEIGSFFHNVISRRASPVCCTRVPERCESVYGGELPMPRNTDFFGPAFRGEGVVRCDDLTRSLARQKFAVLWHAEGAPDHP